MTTSAALKKVLHDVASRKLSAGKAFSRLRFLSHESLKFVDIDHHRSFRKGMSEAIFSERKSVAQLQLILRAYERSKEPALLTRLHINKFKQLKKSFPKLRYEKKAEIAYLGKMNARHGSRMSVAVVTAGTSDIGVAEEAACTLEFCNVNVNRFYDCGVAGLHRLLDRLRGISKSEVIICCAGMDGVLPTVLAGLLEQPVIAVPTSIGYGANFKGLSALLTMLNSCAPGIGVVNIDNGFGAACLAYSILRRINVS